MRKNTCFVLVLVILLSIVLFTASCNKEVVQTQSEATTEPEVQKAPDVVAEQAEDEQLMDQLREEADAQEAAAIEFVNENVNFEFDSAVLSEQAQLILNGMAEYMRTNPDISITIEGHCDNRGTNEYNVALGERRAASAKTFLADLGIGTNRMDTVSYGEERPIAMGDNEASWAQNRRAEFVIN